MAENTQALSVVTWNVHQWSDEHDADNFARVLEVLKDLHADIIGLQEVRRDGRFDYTIEHLAKALDMDFAVSESQSHISNIVPPQCEVIFAKKFLQMENRFAFQMKIKMKQERSVCGVSLTFASSKFKVYCTHLDVGSERIRLQQIEHFFGAIDLSEPHILMGDWNALCRTDYSDSEWSQLTELRKKKIDGNCHKLDSMTN